MKVKQILLALIFLACTAGFAGDRAEAGKGGPGPMCFPDIGCPSSLR